MKKKAFAAVILISCCCTLFAGWLDDVTDTVDKVNTVANTVDNVVNSGALVKTTINNLQNTGNKYINRKVQISGQVMGMAVINSSTFAVFVQNGNEKIKVTVSSNPYCRLLDSVTVTGTYTGDGIDNAVIN